MAAIATHSFTYAATVDQRAMTDFRVPRFVPGDACQIVLRLKIDEANVPQKGAERLNGIDLIPLRHYLAYQLKPSRRVRVVAPAELPGDLDENLRTLMRR